MWALKMFSKLIGVDHHPSVIISDRELALMNAIRVVFPRTPNLLCLWHIEKNILAKCKPKFKEDVDWEGFLSSWTKVIKSPDESSFNEAWRLFEVQYKEYGSVLDYIRGTWLPQKEKFVSLWTEQITHFGNHVTSRAEGAHATLKKYLQVSTGSLHEVKDKICLAIDNQFQEIKAQLSSEKIRVPAKFCIPFFKELINQVSFFALYQLYKQYELSKSKSYQSQCKGHFFKTMGMPCVHMITERKVKVLALNDIHDHWRIDTKSFSNGHISLEDEEDPIHGIIFNLKDKYHKLPLMQKEDTKMQLSQILGSPLPSILEPKVQPHKGRPLGSKKRKESNSTRREPSKFELVEKLARKI